MNVTEFGNYPNRLARGTHPRRAESYTDTITQTLARRQVSQHVSRSGEWALLFRDRQKSRARIFRRCRSGCHLFDTVVGSEDGEYNYDCLFKFADFNGDNGAPLTNYP